MKWSVQQLQKLTLNRPFKFDEMIDFSHYASEVFDLIKIEPAKIVGQISSIGYDKFHVTYHIDVILTVECSLTLDPVDYHFSKEYDEIFSTNPTEDEYLIEKNTLDLESAVWSNIIIDKPLIVTKENAYEILKERGIVLNETFDDNCE